MKRVVTFLALTINIISLVAQRAEANEELNDENYISIPAQKKRISSDIPFSSVSISDIRFDTVAMGFAKDIARQYRGELRIKEGLSSGVKKFYEQLLGLDSGSSGGVQLVCYIKKFFLSDFIFVEMTEEAKMSSKKLDRSQYSGIMAEIELYAYENEKFYPLYRFDSTFFGIKNISKESGLYISDALNASLEQLSSLNWEKLKTKGRVVTAAVLNERYGSRKDIPVLTRQPVKGVFLSFEEFKNNKPSLSEFTYQRSSKGDFLYVKNKKAEDSLYRDFWGLCDGKDLYIYSAGYFFLLERQQNSFSFFGARDLTSKRKMRLNFGLIDLLTPNSAYSKSKTYNDYKLVKSYFLLDMDSGDFY